MPVSFADRLDFAGFSEWNDFVAINEATTVAVSPTFIVVPGFTLIGSWSFSGTVLNALTGTFEMMHDYHEGTDVFPHIHWSPSTNAAGNVLWNLTYTVGNPFQEFTPEVSLTLLVPALGLGANGRPIHTPVEIGAIKGTSFLVGTQIRFSIIRDPTNAADTYPDGALLWATGAHYLSDSVGSRNRFTK